MKAAGFVLSLIVTVALALVFSVKIGSVPPLGYFFDPFHGFWQNAHSQVVYIEPTLEGKTAEPVTVLYDSMLVPHIFAQSDADLYWSQGYIQASHRLWQMEFVTHIAAGRLSEIVGEPGLQFDRRQRRKGLGFAAENAWQAVQANDTTRNIVQAYSDGVNAYIESLTYSDYPLEYKLLDYKPEPWTPLKSSLLLKYMADDLAGYEEDLENTNALRLFSLEQLDHYFPLYLPDSDPVIPSTQTWDFDPIEINTPASNSVDSLFTFEPTEKPNPDNGSNNWAMSGSRTQSGSPLLANDPHLGLNLPSIWYLVQLHAPGVNVFGATLPGSPGVIIGFNDSIAWGLTNAQRDVKDWYRVAYADPHRQEYYFGDRKLKAQVRVEEISIRGQDTFYDTVMYTHQGPVMYDHSFPTDSLSPIQRDFAMKWVAHDPTLELMTFYQLNRAHNYDEYVQALDSYGSPAQNFVFASASNDVALWVQGDFPAKWNNQGRFLMDGRRPELEWNDYIPQSQNAHVLNPERGFVSSANQVPADSTYPYYIYNQGYEHFRNRRINSRLSQMRRATPRDMMELQNDTYNQKAADVLSFMLDSLDSTQLEPNESDRYNLLRAWNLQNTVRQTAPTVFSEWWDTFYDYVWDEFMVEGVALDPPNDAATIYLMKNFPQDTIYDSKLTPERESLKDQLQLSFRAANEKINRWEEEHDQECQWGDYKATSVQHMLQIPAFSVTDIPVGGGRNIVSANSSRHGASWKMVVALGEQVQAWGVYPGGQSGNPGSPYYTNLLSAWAKGEYFPIRYYRNEEDAPLSVLARQNITAAPLTD